MTLLEIAQLTGGYGETDILNGIDLTVEQGEILTVAGTNGAGKSTLAKAVMGLLPRVAGRIALDGADILAEPVERRLALGIAYVPQVGNVFASLSVLENLQVVQGVRDAKARIAELLDAFPALAERRRARAGPPWPRSARTRSRGRRRRGPASRRRRGRGAGSCDSGAPRRAAAARSWCGSRGPPAPAPPSP